MSKILSGENTGDLQRWIVPPMDAVSYTTNDKALVDSKEKEDIHQQAHAKGYQMGRWEGMNAGREELDEQCARLKKLIAEFAQPMKQLDQQVERELVLLAGAMAGQLTQREITVAPAILNDVVHKTVAALQSSVRRVDVHLSPQDAELVKDSLQPPDENQSWHIVSDPSLQVGNVQVKAGHTLIDASLRTRLNQLIADILKVDITDVIGAVDNEGNQGSADE